MIAYENLFYALTQKLMGHSNIATTASYDMRSLDEIKKAAQLLPF